MNPLAEAIFLAGIESVLPDKMIQATVKKRDETLTVGGFSFSLAHYKNLYVIGAGKAAALMAKGLEAVLEGRITDGLVVVKDGHTCELTNIRVAEAGHPVPDERGVKATKELLEIARKAGESDLVICLISGGASALLADFPEESSLNDLRTVNQLLLKSGADIQEMNTIRKHLSGVKGGQLANIIYPASFIALILSDVIGDPIDVIASGPTSPDPSTYKDAHSILQKYGLLNVFPASMTKHLERGAAFLIPETPKTNDVCFGRGKNVVIGSNKTALDAAGKKAQGFGFQPYLLTSELNGDVEAAADFILREAKKIQDDPRVTKPVCLLAGGEPTIKITGDGLGGRNQHFALYCATKIQGQEGLTILCAGTDGTDGPTDVAGAVVDGRTTIVALEQNLDPLLFLHTNDSYSFFKQIGGHIITGSTMTNVMDMIVVLVENKDD